MADTTNLFGSSTKYSLGTRNGFSNRTVVDFALHNFFPDPFVEKLLKSSKFSLSLSKSIILMSVGLIFKF